MGEPGKIKRWSTSMAFIKTFSKSPKMAQMILPKLLLMTSKLLKLRPDP